MWRSWRAIADAYDPPRVFVGEVAVVRPERLARYVRPDELHTAFNFDFAMWPWDAARAAHVDRRHDRPPLGASARPPTVGARQPRRAAPPDALRLAGDRLARPVAAARRARRTRSAASGGPARPSLLTLALPGGAYVYQGEELGLPEVLDLPDDLLQDPMFWERSGRTVRGRDGCRVPIPWAGEAAPFGFGPAGRQPWLPQPASWAALTVERRGAPIRLRCSRSTGGRSRIRRARAGLRRRRVPVADRARGRSCSSAATGCAARSTCRTPRWRCPPAAGPRSIAAAATGDCSRPTLRNGSSGATR